MQIDAVTLMEALNPVYDKAISGVSGVPGMEPSEQLAREYLEEFGSVGKGIPALVNNQVANASASGFVTGIGGLLTLPVTAPANFLSVTYVQLQLVTAIAYMGEHDPNDQKVRSLCYLSLCGDSASGVLKSAGVTIGKRLTERAITRLSSESISKINQAVGFRLLASFGQMGAVNLSKIVPLVGGVIGGTFDGARTYNIGKAAQELFIEGYEKPPDGASPKAQDRDIEEIFEILSDFNPLKGISELMSPEDHR